MVGKERELLVEEVEGDDEVVEYEVSTSGTQPLRIPEELVFAAGIIEIQISPNCRAKRKKDGTGFLVFARPQGKRN